MNKQSIKGFIKAAAAAGLTRQEATELFKAAMASDQAISPIDMAHIRAALRDQGSDPAYGSNSQEDTTRYRADLLQRRDESLDKIPELEGILAGLGAGTKGALIGGGAGAASGYVLKHTPLLNIHPKFKTHLPTGMGVSAAVLAGILSSLPAAKKDYERTRSIKKLNSPQNMGDLLQGNRVEQEMLYS